MLLSHKQIVTDDDDSESEGLFSELLNEDGQHSAGEGSSDETPSQEVEQDISETAVFSDVEYINFGTFTYHLRRDGHDETICSIKTENKEFKSSSRKPDLLDPCKPCHGQFGTVSNEEVSKQLRRSLAEKVDTVAPAESTPGKFSRSEMIALREAVPTSLPDGENSPSDLRYQLSRGIVDVENRENDPTRFTKNELEALDNSLDGKGLIPKSPEIVIATEDRLLKRIPLLEVQLQRRGGKGIEYIDLDGRDQVESVSLIWPRNHLFFFTTLGEIYKLQGQEILSRPRHEAGVPMTDFLKLDEEERVVDVITAPKTFDHKYIITTTEDGHIKRTSTDEFTNILSTGIKAVELEGTGLVGALWSEGESDILLSSAEGKSIRFEEKDARPMSRTAKGVGGINLGPSDQLSDSCIIESEFKGQIVTVTEKGFGKRTPVGEYRRQKRFGKGLVDIDTGERNGRVIANGTIKEEDNIIVATTRGRAVRVPAEEISCYGRNTKGVNIIELDEGDSVSGMTVVPSG